MRREDGPTATGYTFHFQISDGNSRKACSAKVQVCNADDASIIFRLNWPAIEAMARANLAVGADVRPSTSLFRVSSNKTRTPVKQLEIVHDCRIVRLTLIGPEKFLSGGSEIAPQHVRIALVVEDIDSLPYQFDGLRICPIGEVEAVDAVVASRKAHPRGCISRSLFYRISKVALG
jgi:hypothetical protein